MYGRGNREWDNERLFLAEWINYCNPCWILDSSWSLPRSSLSRFFSIRWPSSAWLHSWQRYSEAPKEPLRVRRKPRPPFQFVSRCDCLLSIVLCSKCMERFWDSGEAEKCALDVIEACRFDHCSRKYINSYLGVQWSLIMYWQLLAAISVLKRHRNGLIENRFEIRDLVHFGFWRGTRWRL